VLPDLCGAAGEGGGEQRVGAGHPPAAARFKGPREAKVVAQFGPEVGLVEGASRGGVGEQAPTVQRTPLGVLAVDEIGDKDVAVQMGIGGPTQAMHKARTEETIGGDERALATRPTPRRQRVLLEVVERGVHRPVVARHHRGCGVGVAQGEQDTDGLGRRKGEVEGDHRMRPRVQHPTQARVTSLEERLQGGAVHRPDKPKIGARAANETIGTNAISRHDSAELVTHVGEVVVGPAVAHCGDAEHAQPPRCSLPRGNGLSSVRITPEHPLRGTARDAPPLRGRHNRGTRAGLQHDALEPGQTAHGERHVDTAIAAGC